MAVDGEPPVLLTAAGPETEPPALMLTATDIPRFLSWLPVGARDGTSVCCRGTVGSCRRTTAHTFVMLSLVNEASDEGGSTAEVQLVLPGAHGAERAPWCEPYLSPGAKLSCRGEPGCDRAESLSVYVTSVILERAAPEPSALARVLDAITERTWGGTDADAATALGLTQAEVSRLCHLVDSERKLALVALSRRLRGLPDARRPARQRGAHISASDVAALETEEAALGASLRIETHWEPASSAAPLRAAACQDLDSGSDHGGGGHGDDGVRESHDQAHRESDQAVAVASQAVAPLELTALPCEGSLPSARGPLTRAEYIHCKKRPQCLWVLRNSVLRVAWRLGGATACYPGCLRRKAPGLDVGVPTHPGGSGRGASAAQTAMA